MTTARKDKIDKWREYLGGTRLPVFSRTVRDVRKVATSHFSSANDLSDVIGHDASMAARVIQIANSPLFNLQNREIDTISAAVVMVGFDAVREIAITVGVIEEMLKGSQHHRIGRHMARAFHAAAQARSFARLQSDRPDEVFVAALLRHVGEMAFWSRADREAHAIEKRLLSGMEATKAEKEVLGFELGELSKGLAQDWHLGELLSQVLSGVHDDNPAVQNVELGHEVAEVLDEHDWSAPETVALMQKLAKHLNLKARDVQQLLRNNLDEAAEIADRFGATRIGEALPAMPADGGGDVDAGAAPVADFENAPPRETDPVVLMNHLAEISNGLEAGESRDDLMHQLLAALENGVGCQRAWFALLTPERDKLVVKYAAGVDADAVQGVSLVVEDSALVAAVLEAAPVIACEQQSALAPLIRGGACAAVGVRIGERSVGVLYMESAVGFAFAKSQVDAFRQMGQQSALILSQAQA